MLDMIIAVPKTLSWAVFVSEWGSFVSEWGREVEGQASKPTQRAAIRCTLFNRTRPAETPPAPQNSLCFGSSYFERRRGPNHQEWGHWGPLKMGRGGSKRGVSGKILYVSAQGLI